jgi:hypothetical protein
MYDDATSIESPSLMESLLGLARGGLSIYREVNTPGPTAPLPAAPRPGMAAPVPWHMKPMFWAAAAALLLGGLLLARRK